MKRHSTQPRRQPRVPGHRRDRLSATTEQALTRWVDSQAARFGVSRSLVIASCISLASGITLDYAVPAHKR